MRIIIAGGRDLKNYALVYSMCQFYLQNTQVTEIVSGKARGADALGERFAKDMGIYVREFPAEWEKYGKTKAGKIRNEQMAKYGTHLIAFWDGKSRGTANMIELAKKHRLKVKVVPYGGHLDV
jgi:hypothetical protein|tara:strand:+ start:307 stop:675 length:369 start_codon:yes stop_codon:yes gene_type:complete